MTHIQFANHTVKIWRTYQRYHKATDDRRYDYAQNLMAAISKFVEALFIPRLTVTFNRKNA